MGDAVMAGLEIRRSVVDAREGVGAPEDRGRLRRDI